MYQEQKTSIDAYRAVIHQKLALLQTMWADEKVQCYNDTAMPQPECSAERVPAIFLAGPTSRAQILQHNWRSEAVALLRKYGWKGWVYVPEPRGLEQPGDFTEAEEIYTWESDRLFAASSTVFWIPRDGGELLGLNTNLELGMMLRDIVLLDMNDRLFLGWPPEAKRMGLPNHYRTRFGIEHYCDLESLCFAAAKHTR